MLKNIKVPKVPKKSYIKNLLDKFTDNLLQILGLQTFRYSGLARAMDIITKASTIKPTAKVEGKFFTQAPVRKSTKPGVEMSPSSMEVVTGWTHYTRGIFEENGT